VEHVIAAVDGVDVTMRAQEDYSAYMARVAADVRREIRALREPEQLYAVAIAANDRMRRPPPTEQGHLQDVSLGWETLAASLDALGEMRTQEAARVLVRLLGDRRFTWDGEGALNIAHALIRCGSAALPCLDAVRDQHRKLLANLVRKCIRAGRDVP